MSLRTAVISRRNEKRRLCNFFFLGGGGGIRCIMGNVEVANSAKVGVSGRVGYESDFFSSVIKLIVTQKVSHLVSY